MKLRSNEAGFSAFEIILIVGVLAVVAVATIHVLNAHKTIAANSTPPITTATSSTGSKATDVSTAPAINKPADLNKAETALDQNDPGTASNGDSNQLDGQASGLN